MVQSTNIPPCIIKIVCCLFICFQMVTTTRIVQYYDLKPYIYTNTTTGTAHGMIVEVAEKLLQRTSWIPGCNNKTDQHFIFQRSTFEEVHRIWGEIKTPEMLSNTTKNRFLFPVLKTEMQPFYTVFEIDSVSVVGLRQKLTVWNKFFMALWQMMPMGYLGLLFALTNAILMFISVSY